MNKPAITFPHPAADGVLTDSEVLERARSVLSIEAGAIARTAASLDQSYIRAVRLMSQTRGRVVFTGMGKSGIMAKKMAATFSSTGTPAIFIHAAEAVHGDLGMAQAGDVLVALSNSGETEELIQIIPSLRLMGVSLIAMVGNNRSTLARQSDVCLQVQVAEEGCPLGLAPMASTTAMLALGDSLAAVLMDLKQFRSENFALYHPRGSLGRRLLIKVSDLMHTGDRLPLVQRTDPLRTVVHAMISSNLGLAIAVDADGRLEGILSDGDIKRILEQHSEDFFARTMESVMIKKPITILPEVLAEVALRRMETETKSGITVMPVVDESGRVVGIIHMHDILKEKIR